MLLKLLKVRNAEVDHLKRSKMGCGCKKKKNTSGKLLPRLTKNTRPTRTTRSKTKRSGK